MEILLQNQGNLKCLRRIAPQKCQAWREPWPEDDRPNLKEGELIQFAKDQVHK